MNLWTIQHCSLMKKWHIIKNIYSIYQLVLLLTEINGISNEKFLLDIIMHVVCVWARQHKVLCHAKYKLRKVILLKFVFCFVSIKKHQISWSYITFDFTVTSISYERSSDINAKNVTAHIAAGIVFIKAGSTYIKIPPIVRRKCNMCVMHLNYLLFFFFALWTNGRGDFVSKKSDYYFHTTFN